MFKLKVETICGWIKLGKRGEGVGKNGKRLIDLITKFGESLFISPYSISNTHLLIITLNIKNKIKT